MTKRMVMTMKKNKKKVIGLVAAAILSVCILMLIAVPVMAEPQGSETYGTCTWTVEDGVLTIRPQDGVSGIVSGSAYPSQIPWHSFRSDITTVNVMPGVKTASDASYLFSDLYCCTNFNVENLDVSNATKLDNMFAFCRRITDTPILAQWNTSNVTSMRQMFSSCSKLTNTNGLAQLNTSNVTNMEYMFSSCEKLTNTNGLAQWDTSNVTDMSSMFQSCDKLGNTNGLAQWDTSNVTDMSNMFSGCKNLTNTNGLAQWDTSNVTNMSSMFSHCSNLTNTNDLAQWDTSNVTNMSSMFSHCSNLTNTNGLAQWDTSNVTDMRSMFESCYELTNTNGLALWDTSNVENMAALFYECENLLNVDSIAHWNTSKNRNVGTMFGSSGVRSVNMMNWDFSQVNNYKGIFRKCSSLSSITFPPSFKPSDFSSINMPSPPNNDYYTGKWIREDRTYGPYTVSELASSYDPNTMSGTWVWEERPSNYTIKYVPAEGAAGSMIDQRIKANEEGVLAANEFYRFNYHFDHWLGSDNNIYTDKQTIPANTFAVGDVLTLTAVMVKNDNTATVSEGMLDLYLHGGEKITVPDLPGGTIYQIWEETEDGWQLIEQSNAAGTIPANGSADAVFVNEYVPGTTSIQLMAVKRIDGRAPGAAEFRFELLEDGNVIGSAENDEAGVILFDPIVYTRTGNHVYTIRECSEEQSMKWIRFDNHEERVLVVVQNDGQGNLSASATYDADGAAFYNETKPGILQFTKEATGGGDPEEEFEFEVRLTDAYGRSLDNIQVIVDD